MKLAILSDTHGLLRPEVLEQLKTVDAILHGGDINKQSIVEQLEQYAPLYVVRGNNDREWAEAIPHDLTVTLGGVTFYMVHSYERQIPRKRYSLCLCNPYQKSTYQPRAVSHTYCVNIIQCHIRLF